MRKISILLLLLFAIFSTQAQVSVRIEKTDNGFIQTKETTTTCTIHNEGDSLVVIMDTNYITGNDLETFVAMLERCDYIQAIDMLKDQFGFEEVEFPTIHQATLTKTITETYQVIYAHLQTRTRSTR